MMYIKELSTEDIDELYSFLNQTPENENGFENPYYGCSREELADEIIPKLLRNHQGFGLKPGYVPDTQFFLWHDNNIIGWFKVRHHLTEALANGSGHIGYGIKREYRGKGYATQGLRLVLQKAREIIPEEEIYMSVNKNNPASLKVQLNNGAYIHHEDGEHYYTRIPK